MKSYTLSFSHIQATESQDNVHEGSKSALSQKLMKVGYNVCVTENDIFESLGPVVQSIVSSTSSLRGQLVMCFRTLSPNTPKFLLKNERSFGTAKASQIFTTKILANLRYLHLKF